MRRVTEFMKQFEKVTQFVKVDIDHATTIYENMIESGAAKVMVIEKNGELIGSLGFIQHPDLHSGELMLVETFWFVDPAHRGCGLLLLDAYENYGKVAGVDKIAMIHLADSYPERLEQLYLKRGYKLVEKHYVKDI
jgi:GNAT superfamily N-acetyltransferase